MLLPILVLAIATIMLVMAYQNTKKKDTTTKAFLIFCYLLVIAICVKYGVINNKQLLEGFEVQMPDLDEETEVVTEEGENDNLGVSLQDLENVSNQSSTLNNLKSQVENSNASAIASASANSNSGNNSNESEPFSDIIQKDSEGTHSVFKPQIIINTNDGSQTDDLSMYMPNANVFVPKGNNANTPTTTTSGSATTTTNATNTETMKNVMMTPGRRSGVLGGGNRNKTQNLFGNGSISQPETSNIKNVNTEPSEDAYNWISSYKNKHQIGGDNSRQYSQERFNDNEDNGDGATSTTNETLHCSDYISKPYIEETRSMLDPSTLTNNSYVPGMQYLPPSNWRQPQHDITIDSRVGNTAYKMNTRALPIAIMDHGTPVNALEIGSDGTIAKTEDEVHLTNVGSILPKFEYREYIDHYSTPQDPYATTTTASPTTTIPNSMV
jgi:hypothetical protein